jgi:hypothetical protein
MNCSKSIGGLLTAYDVMFTQLLSIAASETKLQATGKHIVL